MSPQEDRRAEREIFTEKTLKNGHLSLFTSFDLNTNILYTIFCILIFQFAKWQPNADNAQGMMGVSHARPFPFGEIFIFASTKP